MKSLNILTVAVLICAGCSKPAEESKSEQLGREMSDKLKAPIEKARAVSEKAGQQNTMTPPE